MFNFTAEELRRTTENWPVYKGSKMKKRRGLGQRRNRIQIVVLSGWLIYPVLKSIGERLSDIHVGKE